MPVRGLGGEHLGYFGQRSMRSAPAVHPRHVKFVRRVLPDLKVVARIDLEPDLEFTFDGIRGKDRERRRAALAQVGEDHTHPLLGGIAADADLGGEACVLRNLLDALARAIELPAVIEAANAVLLDPPD